MTTISNQMLSAIIAADLKDQLAVYDAHDGSASWLATASHALHPKDFDKLIACCRKRVEKLEKEADGCPSRIWDWQKHFSQDT